MTGIVWKHPTLPSRFLPRFVLATFVVVAVLVGARPSDARPPEQYCQKGRYDAAAKYVACQQKLLGKLFGRDDVFAINKIEAALSKCRVKYTATWSMLQANASGTGTTCDHARYEDNGDGTVTDGLTGLQWEKKQNADTAANGSDPHDADNYYSWSTTPTAADGTAFTVFLAALNSGGCFGGQCDWRLPTIYELQTILLESYPCATSPCIDQAVFGPMIDGGYWSATTFAGDPVIGAWIALFGTGYVTDATKFDSGVVRAVRGGL